MCIPCQKCRRLRGLVHRRRLVFRYSLNGAFVISIHLLLPGCTWWKGLSCCDPLLSLHGSHCLVFGFCSVLVPSQLRDLHTRQLSVVDCVGAVRHSKTCLMAVNLIASHLMAFLLSRFLSSMWGICLFQSWCGRAACRYFLVSNPQLIRKHNPYGYLKMMRSFTSSVAVRVHWHVLAVLFGLPIRHQFYL